VELLSVLLAAEPFKGVFRVFRGGEKALIQATKRNLRILLHIVSYCAIWWHKDKGYFMQLLSIEDLAVYLGDSKRTIYKYIASGDCPPYMRISGKNIKFDRADVDAWLESKKIYPENKKGDEKK